MPDEYLDAQPLLNDALEKGDVGKAAFITAMMRLASSCKGEEHGGKVTEEQAIEKAFKKLEKEEKLSPEQVDQIRKALDGELPMTDLVKMLNDMKIIVPREVLQDFFKPEVPFYKRLDPNAEPVPALFAIIDEGLHKVKDGRLSAEELTKYVVKMIHNLERLEEKGLLPEVDGKKVSISRDFIDATIEKDGQQISVLDFLKSRREELLRNNENNTAYHVAMLETFLEERSKKVQPAEQLEDDPLRKRRSGWNPAPGQEREVPNKLPEGRENLLAKYERKVPPEISGVKVNKEITGANRDRPLRDTK